jgi:hypothetical protein
MATSAFPRTPIVGASALCHAGSGWRGLGDAVATVSYGTYVDVPGMPAETPLANPRARKMMSRGAYLAARCLADLLGDLAWRRANVGYFLGVGASGGSLDDVRALLDASIIDGTFSLTAFGDQGLAACNPLLAFQLMNNFTLCHGAILEGIGGPNAALFSRGSGTVAALIEAAHAIAEGDCEHAITGGADSATHPVTVAELTREGFLEHGLEPKEGAALLALGAGSTGARVLGYVDNAIVIPARHRALDPVGAASLLTAMADEAVARLFPAGLPDRGVFMCAPWGGPARAVLDAWMQANTQDIRCETSFLLGETLAASPALAWVAALDLLVAQNAERAVVLSAGVDGDLGAVLLSRGDA